MTYCSEFLRIMADFSTDSCDSTEMISRVKSLQATDDDLCFYDEDAWLVDDAAMPSASTPVGELATNANGFEDVLQHVNLSSEEERPFTFIPASDDDVGSNGGDSDNESAKSDWMSVDGHEDSGVVCWGEADEHGMLDIDHRAICDKSNRFLGQWGDKEDGMRQPSTVPVTPPPRDISAVADTTRMVNHILASCLKKRKLHVPYKHQVKLINFNPIKPPTTSAFSVSTDEDDDDDFTIRPTTAADPIVVPPPTAIIAPALVSSQTPTMSKARDVHQLARAGMGIQPTKDKKIDLTMPRKQTGPKMKSPMGTSAAALLAGEKRKHSLISLSTSALSFSPSPTMHHHNLHSSLHLNQSSDDDESFEMDMMVVDQDILDLGNSITASMSRIVRPKQECLPLPDFGNMPQDLRELKLKIEATENKVEGTKHRHRKGGPCPRCQVQNQLRAAKRALLCRMKRYK
ncbi:Aste57867_2163 [Aphanomyces stellatus]|uniref:Aste57867_2163 protein n=1 Tax=Aphanomyces stellatus TaxID=120398 RepID=A0A485KAM9_9STRA|nr:hypothetical protein As57867_002158 [Aphanomyces stellatus]VFT79366.1 Aste57867_2163 [Aphanomyces stellatus]